MDRLGNADGTPDVIAPRFPTGRLTIIEGTMELVAGVFDIVMTAECSVCKRTYTGPFELLLFHLKNHEEKG